MGSFHSVRTGANEMASMMVTAGHKLPLTGKPIHGNATDREEKSLGSKLTSFQTSIERIRIKG